MLRICALFVLMMVTPALALDGAVSGVVRVIDGDTLDVGGARVRLHGIDAVEVAQTCKTEQGRDWACGTWVKAQVARRYDGARARCAQMDTDRYGRIVARCTVAGQDIGAALVAEGLATAYRRYSSDYVVLETAARRAERGLWAMQAQSPEAFRHAAPVALSTAPVVAASEECRIKGNISAKGERVYHLPGQRDYDATQIATGKGEQWFCSEAEAQAAGWRRARR